MDARTGSGVFRCNAPQQVGASLHKLLEDRQLKADNQ